MRLAREPNICLKYVCGVPRQQITASMGLAAKPREIAALT